MQYQEKIMSKLDDIRVKINAIDRQMATLFEARMKASREVAEYKKEQALPIYDAKREKELIEKNVGYIENSEIQADYLSFFRHTMDVSKQYQRRIIEHSSQDSQVLRVTMKDTSYDVIIQNGGLQQVQTYFSFAHQKTLIITDSGVPRAYVDCLYQQLEHGYVYTIEQGESSKSFENYENMITFLIKNAFSRHDAIIALGGGVVGDLAGFVASTYMRGIAFYNIPTTLLSQVDSSIGGKTAIDQDGIKNIVGSFYPPKGVLIDPMVLRTLDKRQFYAGLVEALKMGATSDAVLFEWIENSQDLFFDIEKIITRALLIKKHIVEQDPKEEHLRKILNFGHTVGHAIESSRAFHNYSDEDTYLHGECVGMGMLYFCSPEVKKRIQAILEKYHLPTKCNLSQAELLSYMLLDKKRAGDWMTVIYVEEIGKAKILSIPFESLDQYI